MCVRVCMCVCILQHCYSYWTGHWSESLRYTGLLCQVQANIPRAAGWGYRSDHSRGACQHAGGRGCGAGESSPDYPGELVWGRHGQLHCCEICGKSEDAVWNPETEWCEGCHLHCWQSPGDYEHSPQSQSHQVSRQVHMFGHSASEQTLAKAAWAYMRMAGSLILHELERCTAWRWYSWRKINNILY